MDLAAALTERHAEAEVERCVAAACAGIGANTSVIVHSAEGPDDPAVTGFDSLALEAGLSRGDAARRIGTMLAEVMRRLLERVKVPRIVVAGGDSSGEVVSRLDIAALTVIGGLAPGAPLCRAWSDTPQRDGLEIVLKGGQMGTASFFGSARAGRLLAADRIIPGS